MNSGNTAFECQSGEVCRFSERLEVLEKQVELLTNQAQTDALTGLYNYRFFADALPREMERSQRSFQPVSLIILDIDHFKKFNDTWGHELGNHALVYIANIIQQTIRKLDIACRFGGEEFIIILPNTDLRSAIAVANRIREAVAASRVQVGSDSVAITASLGVDEYRPHHADSVEGLIERVDAWLYKAKHAGRNCVMSPDMVEITHRSTVTADEKDALFNSFSSDEEIQE